MTAQALADRCTDLGHPLDRSVVAKLEKGHRQTVTVAEVIALARALRVPPILLIYPVGDVAEFEALPAQIADTWDAAKWFTGRRSYPERQTPDHPQPDDYDGLTDIWSNAAQTLSAFMQDDDYRREHMKLQSDVRAFVAAAGSATTDQDRREYEQRADAARIRLRDAEDLWRNLRGGLRKRGVEPPALRPDLAPLIDRSPNNEEAAH